MPPSLLRCSRRAEVVGVGVRLLRMEPVGEIDTKLLGDDDDATGIGKTIFGEIFGAIGCTPFAARFSIDEGLEDVLDMTVLGAGSHNTGLLGYGPLPVGRSGRKDMAISGASRLGNSVR